MLTQRLFLLAAAFSFFVYAPARAEEGFAEMAQGADDVLTPPPANPNTGAVDGYGYPVTQPQPEADLSGQFPPISNNDPSAALPQNSDGEMPVSNGTDMAQPPQMPSGQQSAAPTQPPTQEMGMNGEIAPPPAEVQPPTNTADIYGNSNLSNEANVPLDQLVPPPVDQVTPPPAPPINQTAE